MLEEKILNPICNIKRKLNGDNSLKLNLYDVLSALALCAQTDSLAKQAYDQLDNLAMCDAHASHMLPISDKNTLKNLRIDISCEPEYMSH